MVWLVVWVFFKLKENALIEKHIIVKKKQSRIKNILLLSTLSLLPLLFINFLTCFKLLASSFRIKF